MRFVSADIIINCEGYKKGNGGKSNYTAVFNEEEKEDCGIGKVKVDIPRSETWDTTGFGVEAPVFLELVPDELPLKMTCMYLYSDWWTRPAFVDTFSDIPARTQVIFCKFEDHFSCILPLVGKVFKAIASGSYKPCTLHLDLDAGIAGFRNMEEDIYIVADGETLEEAVKKTFKLLAEKDGLKLKEDRKLPEMLKYLGWCSWDAFYKEISADKIREKADELIEKNVPIRWMLFDDGWMKNENDMLLEMKADKEKFPNGFAPLIDEIKERSSIKYFGVWHAFGGYWAGIDPESELAEQKKDCLYKTRNGRIVPSPFNGSEFYSEWYRYLKDEHIDFIKVDGQSAMPTYFRNDISFVEAAKGMHAELEKSSEIFGKNVINCMGMAMENIVSREDTSVSRNSDDFIPLKETDFAEHLLQNAFNSIYHDEVYYCDWDMFWTKHPDAEKHGLLRAISGGPVYFSDRIGETDANIVKRLCLLNGELLMPDRAAMAADDCAFTDPYKEGILKVQNVCTLDDGVKVGVIALFNLTDAVQETEISPKDIPELDREMNYWMYDYREGTAEKLPAGVKKKINLEAGDYKYIVMLPHKGLTACIGLKDIYTGVLAAKTVESANGVTMVLRETGNAAWISEKRHKKVLVNGEEYTDKVKVHGNIYEIEKEQSSAEMKIELFY